MNAWLQLARISNLPSALSNIVMAHWVAQGAWGDLRALVLLLIASGACYTAGMILNDWADADRDRIERPERPIPSGRIRPPQAFAAALSLLFAGLVTAVACGFVGPDPEPARFNPRPIAIVCLLIVAIWAYDVAFKPTWFAPWLMGTCRGLNVLLGASVGAASWPPARTLLGLPDLAWALAVGLTLYTAGLTYLARREANQAALRAPQQRHGQRLGWFCLALAFAVLVTSLHRIGLPGGAVPGRLLTNYSILMGVIALFVLGRAFIVLWQPTPRNVGAAVASALRSMIMIDAALCWVASRGNILPPSIVLGLLILSILLGRYSRVT